METWATKDGVRFRGYSTVLSQDDLNTCDKYGLKYEIRSGLFKAHYADKMLYDVLLDVRLLKYIDILPDDGYAGMTPFEAAIKMLGDPDEFKRRADQEDSR